MYNTLDNVERQSVGSTLISRALAICLIMTTYLFGMGCGDTGSTSASLVISPPGGTYATDSVIVTFNQPGVDVIYYTTDGTTPTTGSQVYTGPFTIDYETSPTRTVSALPVVGGLVQAIKTVTYSLDLSLQDSDGDTIADDIDSDPYNPFICMDGDNNGCDDCSSGTFNPIEEDVNHNGVCDAIDHQVIAVADCTELELALEDLSNAPPQEYVDIVLPFGVMECHKQISIDFDASNVALMGASVAPGDSTLRFTLPPATLGQCVTLEMCEECFSNNCPQYNNDYFQCSDAQRNDDPFCSDARGLTVEASASSLRMIKDMTIDEVSLDRFAPISLYAPGAVITNVHINDGDWGLTLRANAQVDNVTVNGTNDIGITAIGNAIISNTTVTNVSNIGVNLNGGGVNPGNQYQLTNVSLNNNSLGLRAQNHGDMNITNSDISYNSFEGIYADYYSEVDIDAATTMVGNTQDFSLHRDAIIRIDGVLQ